MLQTEAENIEAAASERGITELIHFTWTSNLDSIFRLGLLSRNKMKDGNYRFTDGWGGYPSHISLSIMFPNSEMFVTKKMASTPEDGFCMLRINPCVMWSGPNAEQTLSCYTNMSNSGARFAAERAGYSAEAFSRLFDPELTISRFQKPTITQRRTESHPNFLTTDPQAEVLIFEHIPPECITGIAFNSPRRMQQVIGDIDLPVPSFIQKAFWGDRPDTNWPAGGLW